MKLELPERQSVELASLASRTGRSLDDLAAEAVDRMLAEDRGLKQQIELRANPAVRGNLFEEDEMDLRFARMIRR